MRTLNELSAKLEELVEDEAELQATLKDLKEEGRTRFPRGFDGNGAPGDYESWELRYSDVLSELDHVRAEKFKVSDELKDAIFRGCCTPD